MVVEDITELKAQAGHIEQLAFYDHLTGLPNRRQLHDRLQQALSVSTRNHFYGAVLMLDLDNFKCIKDTRGHDVGDRLLAEVARRIQTSVRQTDTVARPGGAGFIVMLVDLSPDEAQAALQAEGVGSAPALSGLAARPTRAICSASPCPCMNLKNWPYGASPPKKYYREHILNDLKISTRFTILIGILSVLLIAMGSGVGHRLSWMN